MNNFVTNLIFSPISTIISLPIQIAYGSVNLAIAAVKTPVDLSVAVYEQCTQNNENKENECIENNEYDQELVDIKLTNENRV